MLHLLLPLHALLRRRAEYRFEVGRGGLPEFGRSVPVEGDHDPAPASLLDGAATRLDKDVKRNRSKKYPQHILGSIET